MNRTPGNLLLASNRQEHKNLVQSLEQMDKNTIKNLNQPNWVKNGLLELLQKQIQIQQQTQMEKFIVITPNIDNTIYSSIFLNDRIWLATRPSSNSSVMLDQGEFVLIKSKNILLCGSTQYYPTHSQYHLIEQSCVKGNSMTIVEYKKQYQMLVNNRHGLDAQEQNHCKQLNVHGVRINLNR